MQITLEQYESIQNYLDGAMTSQEEKDFLNALNQDSSLKESFEFEKELRRNLTSINDKENLLVKDSNYYEADKSSEAYNSIKSLIEKAGNEWEGENKKSRGIARLIIDNKPGRQKAKIVNIRLWPVIAAAACVIVAVASLVWFMPKSPVSPPVAKINDTSSAKKNTNTDITETIPKDSLENMTPEIKTFSASAWFKKYYTKDRSHPPMPDLLAMVPADYLKGDYSYREINLNRPLTRGSSNDINSRQNILQFGRYYKGLSYIETNDNKQAIENLAWVIDSAQSRQLKMKAQWYLALIYLKEKNATKAASLLSVLSINGKANPYYKEAAELLKTLKEQQQK